MRLNHFILRKLQTSLQIPVALSRRLAAAADPMAKRRYRPLFPLYSAAVAESAADKSAQRSGNR